mgnify:CR=1 FL=1
MSLVDNLVSLGYLKTPEIISAFRKIKRVDFLPENIKNLNEIDKALPIGEGQTISQPAVVAFMLELLKPKPGDKVLDIGSGSGWTTALLAYIVSKKENSKSKSLKGKVISIEIILKLKEFGERNVSKYNFIKKGIVSFIHGDGTRGFKKEAPFDRILVSAAAEKVPKALKEQLKIDGRLVIPVKDDNFNNFSYQSIWLVEKKKDGFIIKKYPGFVFVPLISS